MSPLELPGKLQDGVLLCRVLNVLVEEKYRVDIRLKPTSASAKKRNANGFVGACVRLNIPGVAAVTAMDIMQGTSVQGLVAVLRELVKYEPSG